MAGKKKTPDNVGGYSYDKIVKNRDKNGRPIYFKIEDGKKKRVKETEYKKVFVTKQYFKKKYKTAWQKKYKEAQQTINEVNRKQKTADKKRKQESAEKLVYKRMPLQPFANSAASDFEAQILEAGKGFFIMKPTTIFDEDENGKKLKTKITLPKLETKVTQTNLMDARLFLSEMADEFYDVWHEADNAGEKVPSPQIVWNGEAVLTLNSKGEILDETVYLYLEKTNFSFWQVRFFKHLIKLFKNYFKK